MRVLLLTPGTGHFFCGSCLRDNALGSALVARGQDAVVVPLYLPFVLEDGEAATREVPVKMGGINLYLQSKLSAWRHAPRWLTDQLDRPGLLRWASTKGDMTDAKGLGEMTVAALKGEAGNIAPEVDKLARELKQSAPPDVVCLSNAMLVGLARRLREALDVPIACTMQGEEPFLDALPESYRRQAWAMLAERARDVDAFIPVSHWYAGRMRERLALDPGQVHVVHNGIDTTDFEALPLDPPATPTIGFLARLCIDKGLPTLVDAFLRLKKAGKPEGLRLRAGGAMIGADEEVVEAARRKIAEAGFADDAEFLPNIDRETKLDLLRSASVLSVPATYGESFGLYLLEALAAGVPVVQPRCAAFPEILEATGGGLLCEPDDPDSLAKALAEHFSDGDAALERARRGRAAVRDRFHVDRMAGGVEAVFQELTGAATREAQRAQ